MAINVTGNISNISVNTTSNVVTVSSTPSNIQLSATSVVSNASVRQAISVSNVSGFGNITYDSSNTSNGIIQYVGTSTTDIRGSLSNTSPITYDSSTGVIGLEQNLSNITLTQYQETVVAHGNSSGNLSVDVANGTIHKFTLTGNVTKIDTPSIQTGGSATVILTQDSTGGHVIDTATNPLNWTNWDFVNDFTTLDTTANAFNILNVLWDGSKYYASLTTDSEIIPDSLTVTGNISAGNISTSGQLDVTGNINGGQVALTGALTSDSNITTTANVNSASFTTTANATVGANLNVLGNLEVTGNINYREVEDLLVRDQTITLNFGNASANDVQIISDRSGSGFSNTDIKWNETTDKWTFTNDGSTYYNIPTSTTDLAEGTNLYYTDARFNTQFATKDTDDLAEGTNNKYFANSLVDNYVTGGNGITYGSGTITLDVAYTRNQFSAAGDLSYNATTGVFSFTNDPGDIEGVTAGTGLTGGGTTGTVTLNVGAGTGITANPDNVAVDMSAFSTSDLSEGTNLYYTNARANAAFVDSLDNITTEISSNSDITTTGNIISGGAAASTSVIQSTKLEATMFQPGFPWTTVEINANSANGFIGMANATSSYPLKIHTESATSDIDINQGNIRAVKFTQFGSGGSFEARAEFDSNIHLTGNVVTAKTDGNVTATNFIGKLVGESDTVASLSGLDTDDLSEGSTNLYYTSARADADIADYTGAIINMTGNLTTTANISADNVLTDHVISDSAQPLQLKGQTDGIKLDKTVASAETRIIDLDTTGYNVQSTDFGTAAVTTANVPGMLINSSWTAGTNTMTVGYTLGNPGLWAGKQTGDGVYTNAFVLGPNFGGPNDFTSALTGQVASVQTKGWVWYDLTTASSTSVLPANAFVTGMSGNTITFSENFISSQSATGATGILNPGAFSTTQSIGLTLEGDVTNIAIPFDYAAMRTNEYTLPETLSNVTLDAVSYGDATVDMANVVLRHMADATVGTNSALRTERAILIGANATPDLLSVGTGSIIPATSLLGFTIEQDGDTDFGGVSDKPQMKVQFNNYSTNSLGRETTYPTWSKFLGQSGNATVDMPYIGAPNFNFKGLGGNKIGGAGPVAAGDIIGKVSWNAITGATASGSDNFNQPASITVRINDDTAGNVANIANTDMHFQSTYPTSYRNGTTDAQGGIPRTFLSSSAGNTIIAAKTDGRIALKPVRDYGDAGDATSYIDNRYAPNLHEYHTFLDAKFLGSKAGTLVTIQPDSGETGGSTDFNYDSKGNATLRFQTHLANNTARYNFDLVHDEANEKFFIESGVSNQQHIEIASGGKVSMKQVMRLHPQTSAEILALTGNTAGDMVYNSTDNLVAYFDGTNWRNIAQGSIIT